MVGFRVGAPASGTRTKSNREIRPYRSLRALRARRGLTPGQLAERLGVTHHTIRAWEKGERAVRKDWRFKLANALGCSVLDLRKGEGIARSKRWRRALANLSDAAPARPSDDAE
jgi:transcriptional regulator with XRE-family HTH domain